MYRLLAQQDQKTSSKIAKQTALVKSLHEYISYSFSNGGYPNNYYPASILNYISKFCEKILAFVALVEFDSTKNRNTKLVVS